MASNKSTQAHLQRRHGRRTSIPASPTFSDRRPGERSARGEVSSPVDPPSVSATGSPMLDWSMSSPAFEVPGISSPISFNEAEDARGGQWEKHNTPDMRTNDEAPRSPSVGTPASDGGGSSASRFPPHMSGFKSSPLSHLNRDGNEHVRTPDRTPRFYERAHVATRNISTTSLSTDRSFNDEQASTKTPTTKKSRLNLLNPMSLLARRRSSQNSKLEDLNISPLHVPAIPDFDPSIRGKIVHDFSSPRVRTPRRDAVPSPAQGRPSDDGNAPLALSSPVMYSPVFKEHFQDDEKSLQPNHTAYLHNKQLDAPQPQTLPAFAQRLPVRLPSHESNLSDHVTQDEIPQPDLPPPPPPPPPEKTPSPLLELPSAANMPKHMKSTSSRFSFQIAGQGSAAQEKILEDKHREHFAKQPGGAPEDDQNEQEYDDYDLDAEDLFEEDIPTAGVDNDYEETDFDEDLPARNIEVQTSQRNIPQSISTQSGIPQDHSSISPSPNGSPTWLDGTQTGKPQLHPLNTLGMGGLLQPVQDFHFTPQNNTMSATSTEPSSQPTPRDPEGYAIGLANFKHSHVVYRPKSVTENKPSTGRQQLFLAGLNISTTEPFDSSPPSRAPVESFDDADLYFDDGEFDAENVEPGDCFDESLLDDGSEQIRDIPAENARRYEAALNRATPGDAIKAIESDGEFSRGVLSNMMNGATQNQQLQRTTSLVGTVNGLSAHQAPGLTEVNLAAYHDALVMAANNAAANGKFNRQVSFSEASEQYADSRDQDMQAGRVSDEGQYSFNQRSSGITEDEPFGFDDDDLDDDLMIAEANAEALENDDDGFYGQEFGFYARAHTKESSDLVNGGYFTTRGSNGIKRSHSGKANFQEPSLTPITERSEWSTRNSVASLHFHGGLPNTAGQSLPSPGISQLLDSPLLDDEMSLSALMRLRRGAFGGSSTSVNSLGERNLPNSSPLAHVSTYTFPPPEPGSGHKLSMSQTNLGPMSIPESEEEDEDVYDRPTLTQNTPKKKAPGFAPETPHEQIKPAHLSPQPSLGKKSHHSRTSSGAESVSYTQDNIGRWILERKRTGDDGELEVIGREYLAAARI